MKKKLLALMLALVLCGGLLPLSASADTLFPDVREGAWYYEDVYYAVGLGLVNGKVTDGQTFYEPDSYVTVAEVIKLAACMHQLATQGHVSLKNGPSVWYSTYEAYAVNNGILYAPYAAASEYNRYASRMEFMSIFARALPQERLQPRNLVTQNSIPDLAEQDIGGQAVYALYRAGVVQGDANHYANPEDNIKRSEVAAIVARMMDESRRLSFTMTSAPARSGYEDESLAEFRAELNRFGVVCGVAYLGFVEDWDDVRHTFFGAEGWNYARTYPFLTSIDMHHWVDNEGYELYAVVPADPNASVAVYDSYMGQRGELLYQSAYGDPILLKGNISEIYSNLEFVITDSMGRNVDWDLQLSGQDGSLVMPMNASAMYNFTLDRDAFLEPQPTGDAGAYVGSWEDSWSGRATMTVSAMGNNQYDIFVRWGNGASSTYFWSLLGEYEPELGVMNYTGIEFEVTFDNPDIPACRIVDAACEGRLWMDADGAIRWSYDEDCAFRVSGGVWEAPDYARISTAEGYAYLNESTRGDYALWLAIPNGTLVGVDFYGDTWSYVYFGDYEGYVLTSQLTRVGAPVSYAVSGVELPFDGTWRYFPGFVSAYGQEVDVQMDITGFRDAVTMDVYQAGTGNALAMYGGRLEQWALDEDGWLGSLDLFLVLPEDGTPEEIHALVEITWLENAASQPYEMTLTLQAGDQLISGLLTDTMVFSHLVYTETPR